MTNRDFTLRGSLKDIDVRFALTDTTDSVNRGIIIHNTDPVASHVFGSALTTGALLSPLLTENEKYSIRWNYNGTIGHILVDVDSSSNLRGIPKNSNLVEAETKADLYGEDGQISVIKAANGKVLNSGTSQAGMLDITDDVSFYLSTSDQIETEAVCAINFNPDPENPVKIAAGFMIQALPNCDLELFSQMRESIKEEEFIKLLSEKTPDEQKLQLAVKYIYEKAGKSAPEDIREIASYEFGESPKYHCGCSKEKMQKALTTLPKDQLEEMLGQPGGIKIACDFCRSSYIITSM